MIIFLVKGDSAATDTVKTYEIPEIVEYRDGTSITGEITPAFYEQSNMDIFSTFPVVPYDCGPDYLYTFAGKGRKPSYSGIYLNGRLLSNPFFGFVDLIQLPLHFFESVSYGRSITGTELSSFNLRSKLNRYDRPYSYARFMFGSFQSNVYGVDFTRAITRNLGLYMSGEYYETDGYRPNTAGQRLSLYSNVYYNQLLPARLDFFYCDNEYGLAGSTVVPAAGRKKDQFLDISSTITYQNGVATLFHNSQSMEYSDTLNARFLENKIKQSGLAVEYRHSLLGAAIEYGLAGCYRTVDGNVGFDNWLIPVSSYVDYPFDIWAGLRRQFGRFSFGAAGRVEKAQDGEIMYCPKLEIGYDFLETSCLYAAFSRDARTPADLEKGAIYDTLVPYSTVAGNENLVPEYCWAKEIGVRSGHFSVNLYRLDFDDLIAVAAESTDYYRYVNINAWRTSGCEILLDLPVRIHGADTTRSITISIGGNGNVLFEGDSSPYVPRYHGGCHLSVMRETERFSLGISLHGEFSSDRIDIHGAEYSGYSVFSAAGFVKYMGLSCTLRLNNVLDEEYVYLPGYPMPPRNFDVSIKWEFWD